jgi:hypothetical protein
MLSALLDRLGALLSKYFIIGSFMPMMIFAFLNGTLLYVNSDRFRGFVSPQLSGVAAGFVTATLLIGLAVTAYALSSVALFLREVLEGKHVTDLLPGGLFQRVQRSRRDEIARTYEMARDVATKIGKLRPEWRDKLKQKADEGAKQHQGQMTYDPKTDKAAEALNKVRKQYTSGDKISFNDLNAAVDTIAGALAENDGGLEPLESDYFGLLVMIDNADDAWTAEAVRCFNEKQFYFGMGDVAPTTMGNIALSMESYTYSRYGFSLDAFWSRLQPVLQAKKDFYSSLLDAKTQLDFLVACCWLGGITTVVWVVLLLLKGHVIFLFLVVAAGGPLLTRLFYWLAVKNYLVFADLVRTSVDLYRFGLLQSLHIAVPRGVREERRIWKSLERLSTSLQEEYELSYELPDKAKL